MSPHPSPYKSTGGLKRVANAARYSLQGLVAALRYESAFRQELMLAAVLVPAAFWVGQNAGQILLLIGSVILVLIVELLNSALEAVADAVSLDTNQLLGRAKDLGSAAVFLSLLVCAVVWLALLANRWLTLI